MLFIITNAQRDTISSNDTASAWKNKKVSLFVNFKRAETSEPSFHVAYCVVAILQGNKFSRMRSAFNLVVFESFCNDEYFGGQWRSLGRGKLMNSLLIKP